MCTRLSGVRHANPGLATGSIRQLRFDSSVFLSFLCGEGVNLTAPPDDFATRRERMVRTQLTERGVQDVRVLAAMRAVPRHEFVPQSLRADAYEDHPLPIGEGQTISQPYIVAAMLEHLCLQAGDRVLEIGTGSGYVTALLSVLCAEVYSVERHAQLAGLAETALRRLK